MRPESGKESGEWCIQTDHGAFKFWDSYLVYRILRETANSPHHRYRHFRIVAERVCLETGAELQDIVDALCWPALSSLLYRNTVYRLEDQDPSPDLDFLCAAAWLNLISVAEQMLEKEVSPVSEVILFSSLMHVAALVGNAQMLELFQNHLPDLEDTSNDQIEGRGKISSYAIRGAAKNGDLNILKLAIYPPSRAASDSTDFMGQKYGHVATGTSPYYVISSTQCYCAKNVEVYTYLESFLEERIDPNASCALGWYSYLGNIEMVRHLLDAGTDIRGTSGHHGNPLTAACERGHEDIVDLLLERGADPNFGGDKDRVQYGDPIPAAAKSGSLSIMRKLLSYGGRLSHRPHALSLGYLAMLGVVQTEHTEMFKFLVESGANLEFGGDSLLEHALSLGLDSIVEVIQEAQERIRCPELPLLEDGQDMRLVKAHCQLRPMLCLRNRA